MIDLKVCMLSLSMGCLIAIDDRGDCPWLLSDLASGPLLRTLLKVILAKGTCVAGKKLASPAGHIAR